MDNSKRFLDSKEMKDFKKVFDESNPARPLTEKEIRILEIYQDFKDEQKEACVCWTESGHPSAIEAAHNKCDFCGKAVQK